MVLLAEMHDMKRLITVTMFAILLASTASGCSTFRNWFCRGDHCDACASNGGGSAQMMGGSNWVPSVSPTGTNRQELLPGPIEVLPRSS